MVYIEFNQDETLHLKRSLEDKIRIAKRERQKIIRSEGIAAYNNLVGMYKNMLNKVNAAGPYLIGDERAKVVHVIVNEEGEVKQTYS